MNRTEKVIAIQGILGVAQDGAWGPKSQAALDSLIHESEPPAEGIHSVLASSFADPADVRAFQRCKAKGGTDQECFKVGDNAVGKWGDSTAEGTGPSCALPPEDWREWGPSARGKKVLVKANGKQVICRLLDTMPARANIHNGAGIDLNPDACEALGLNPPILVRATWQWA